LAVDGKILLGEPGKMADHRGFIRFREGEVLPEQFFRQGTYGYVGLGKAKPPAAGNAFVVY
jgi:hypothetical protein